MEPATSSWWRRHGWTATLLLAAFGIAILVRTLFMAQIIELWGPLNVYGGGSDSFYHSRVMEYIIQNHANLGRDPLLNYPNGAVNPREPLFDWMNALLGLLFAPLFGGSAISAGAWFLDAGGPIWAALGVFPVYLIGREVSSRRMGIIAAFLYPLMVANIDSSTFGYANYLAFYTFFILLTVYGFLRMVKAVGTQRWVTSYRDPKAIRAGLLGFLRTERNAVKWAVFAGVSFGTLALAWQGYTFFVAAVVIFIAFAFIVERIRKVDSFGLYVGIWIVGLVGFPMAVPYYLPQGLFAGWFDIPLLLYFGALIVVTPFLMLRDYPWVVSIPALASVGAVVVGALFFIDPSAFTTIVTGQGYFVKTLVYSTVAEAQAPSVDQLIIGYGVATFFLAFVGLALYLAGAIRSRFRRTQMMFIVFAIISIYLPVSAAKFFFLGSAAFSLLAAEAVVRLVDIGGYPTLRRNVVSLSDRRSQLGAFRRAFKARHVLVIVALVVIITPNIWYAVDAGIPYNSKTQYDQQIYNTLPPPLRTSPSNASSFYLGAGGTQLDTPDQYDEDGYNWLATQDTNLPPPQRPAFVSWWDYGFQAVAQGNHPTVADNFQNGIDPAGNFLLAQNESLAMGVLTTRLLNSEQTQSGDPYLPAGLNHILAQDGLNVTKLHNLLENISSDVPLVLKHPNLYGPYDAGHLDSQNAMYDAVSYYIASSLSESGVAHLYNDVQSYTGWSVRYAMVDSRLFPTSGQSTGIFYAPVDLTDGVVSSGGVPTTFFNVTVTGSDGGTYQLGSVPPGVLATNYNIAYKPAFYNSMIYRIFAGYNGTDIGQGAGIPGLQTFTGNSISSNLPLPGWMLQHFQVVYQTSYYCPYPANQTASHPNCYRATNLAIAEAAAKAHNGSVVNDPNEYYGLTGAGGESILEYYAGQTMVGTITLPTGAPVSGARVTVADSWKIPHMSVVTGADGSYSVVLPPGNDTVNVTTGPINGVTELGGTTLYSMKINVPDSVGFNPEAPTLVRPISLAPSTISGFVYWNEANNSTYIAHSDPIIPGATITVQGPGTVNQTVTTDASGSFDITNLPPGTYNVSVLYQGHVFSQPQAILAPGKIQNATAGLSPSNLTGKVFIPQGGFGASGATVTVTGPTGVVARAVTNSTGAYRIDALAPGNYSVSAAETASGLGTIAHSLTIATTGAKSVLNLTLVSVTTVDLVVTSDGAPVAGIPVRFTPIVSASPTPTNATGNGTGGNSTHPAGAPVTLTEHNSSVFLTNADGYLSATLPAANYSLYAVGLVGTALRAGFSQAYLTPGVAVTELAPLPLFPAVRLSGEIATPTTSTTTVTAFTANGSSASAATNASGAWVLFVPAGTYSLLAVQQPVAPSTGPAAPGTHLAGVATVTASYATSVPISLVPAIVLDARVGAPTYTNGPGFYPAGGATVRVSISTGWGVTTVANDLGNLTLTVPSTLPTGVSYCLSASATGFTPFSNCGLSPTSLSELTTIPLALTPVSTNLTLTGVPGSVRLTVNFTALSSTAVSKNATGGPAFQLSLSPGTYEISAWAPSPTPPGFLYPTSPINVTIPVGTTSASFKLAIFHEVKSVGVLSLPTGLLNSSVSVTLSAASGNLSVPGNEFDSGFYAAPGTYRVFAAGAIVNASAPGSASVAFATVATVTVNATGHVAPAIVLDAQAAHLVGNLTLPTGGPANGTFRVTFVGSAGVNIVTTASNGFFSTFLPANETYTASASGTVLVTIRGIPQYESVSVAAGATCTATYPSTTCNIPLTAVPITSTFAGTVTAGSFPGPVDATIHLLGPLPSTAVTLVSVVNGTFSASVLPGSYQAYTLATTGFGPLGNLTTVTISPRATDTLAIALAPTWTDSLTLVAPSGVPVYGASVVVSGPSGPAFTLTNVSFGVTTPIALPAGIYTISATTAGAAYGLPANASASSAVVLVGGNSATRLALAYHVAASISITLLEPSSTTVTGGDTATVSFVARNVGSAPGAVHFVGSPAGWNITIVPENATLGVTPANSSVTVTATAHVPSGALATPPPAAFVADFANGSSAGPATGWTVHTTAYLAIAVGRLGSGTVVAPKQGTLTFYVLNNGNVPATTSVSIENALQLAAMGWTSSIQKGNGALVGSTSLAPASNTTFSVRLTATTIYALYPSVVDLVVTSTNGTILAMRTLALPVPLVNLNLSGSAIQVTGPNLGSPSPYPDWLVPALTFVPVAALIVGVVTWRWWRTRRWTRR